MAYPSPRRLQLRRGNAAAVASYLGYAGELVVNTTDWTLYVHDGVTVGGNPVNEYSNSSVQRLLGNFNGNIVPSANVTYSLGNITHQWRDLFVSNSTIYVGGVPLTIDNTGNLTINGNTIPTVSYVNAQVANVTVDLSSYALNANVTAANLGMKGYVDQANSIQSSQLTQANLGIIGYINQGNTIQSQQIVAANVGMKGYVDNAVSSIVIPVTYSNVNVAAYLTTEGYAKTGDITTANVGMKGYVDSQNFYSNAKVAAYLQVGNTSNISVAGNVTATYFVGNGALLTGITASSSYSNVQVATYLPTYTGTLAGGALNLAGQDGTTVADFQTGAATNQIITLGSNYTFSIKAGAAESNRGSLVLESGQNSRVKINGNGSNVLITAGNGTQSSTWTFANSGVLTFPDGTTMTTASAGGSNYGNTNVAAYLNTQGYNLYSNVNVAAYLSSQGIIAYSNVNVEAFTNLSTYAYSANVTTANVGLKGYVDQANTTMKDYVDGQIAAANTNVGGGTSYGNGNVASYLITNGYINSNSAYSNINVQAYTETIGFTNYSNINVQAYTENMGFANYSNVNVAAYTTTQGYTNYSNVNTKAYTEAMGFANYSNVNVAAYLPSYNGNLSAGSTSIGSLLVSAGATFSTNVTILGNLQVSGTLTTVNASDLSISNLTVVVADAAVNSTQANGAGIFVGGANSSVLYNSVFDSWTMNKALRVQGNVTGDYFLGSGQFISSLPGYAYSNVNVAAYLNTQGYNLYSNVNVAAYLSSTQISVANIILRPNGNITFADGTTQISAYSNVQTATYLPVYSGNVANIRLGPSGVLTFSDGTTMTTAASGVGSNYGNVNVKAYTETMGFRNYSNVNVAAYLGTGQIIVSNVRLAPSGNIVFADGTVQTTAASGGGSNYGNGNVASYLITNGYINTNSAYSNANVTSYLPTHSGNVGVNNLIGTTPNVTLVANSYSTTFDIYGNVAFGNTAYPVRTYTTGTATVTGTLFSSGNTNATAFAVVGSGAVSNVALGYFPPTGTAAQMAIRDYSTANSTMYFDTTIGSGNIGGQFQFRGSSSFTQYAQIDRFGIRLPTRPAFRVNGTGGPSQTTSNVNLKSPQTTVVFNQGGYYNDTTGQFTAPVAGIYQVSLVARVTVNSAAQIAVLRNGVNSGGNVVCFWEADTNTGTATHFGTSGTVQLAVGDYLSANILLGSVNFDGNDNWSVTYIG